MRDGAAADAAEAPSALSGLATTAAAARAAGMSAAEIVVDIDNCVHARPNQMNRRVASSPTYGPSPADNMYK